MSDKYRILEQYGSFRIEEKRESEVYLGAITMLLLYIKGKKTPKYTYWISAVNKLFATKQEAIDYIPKLTPKYHNL